MPARTVELRRLRDLAADHVNVTLSSGRQAGGEVYPRINAIGWREAKGRSSSNSASEVHPRIKPRVLPISTASYRFDAFSFLNIRAMWVLTVLWLM